MPSRHHGGRQQGQVAQELAVCLASGAPLGAGRALGSLYNSVKLVRLFVRAQIRCVCCYYQLVWRFMRALRSFILNGIVDHLPRQLSAKAEQVGSGILSYV